MNSISPFPVQFSLISASNMILRSLLFLACTATRILADVEFTSPEAGGTEDGGSQLSIKWKDSGDDPKLSDLVSYQLFLCAGGNDASDYVSLPQPLNLLVLRRSIC